MTSSGVRRPLLPTAVGTCAAVLMLGAGVFGFLGAGFFGVGTGGAAPSASSVPPSDSQGYIDSTARCTAPATVVVFGSTESSRVAICAAASGAYQYRGVRVRDGAKLVLPAKSNGSGGYVAVNNGITYTLTASALTVSDSSGVIRKESMVDFHDNAPATKTSTSSGASSGVTTTQSPPPGVLAPTTVVTPTTAPPPPLPAEVGGR